MGNCLPLSNNDNASLLHSGESVDAQDNVQIEQTQSSQVQMYSGLIQPPFYQVPTVSRSSANTAAEDELKIAKRMGLIQHLPMGKYNGSKKTPECVICMIEFCIGEPIRFLPCMHIYHVRCIDDWLLRSLTCPSCMEPVDAALLNSYEST